MLCTSRVIDVWTCLNDDIVKSPSISVFKKRLSGVKFDRFLTVTDCLYVFCLFLRMLVAILPFTFN